MAKSDLGTKRICPTTGKKFYDLNKSPVISPYTGEVVPIAPMAPARGPAADAARAPAPLRRLPPPKPRRSRLRPRSWCRSRKPTPRRTPARSRPSFPNSEDDIEIDETIEDDDDDDSTFIADEEEGDEDVTDIIGDVGGDEET